MEQITAVRIVSVDYYMCAPLENIDVMHSEFRGAAISQVPVVRIFGSTNEGKKTCLHIHGVFPYLYIPYDGSVDANILKYQIATSLDKAINISFGKASSTTQHVYKITLVSGIPFYGYHARHHQFFRIYFYHPGLIRKVANLLLSDAVLGKIYQPHESHIQFTLQFMIDYNLHGMSKILVSEMKTRDDPNKQSVCELEADVHAEHIINRIEVSSGNLAINPGIAALWEDEKQRRRAKNEESQIGPCLSLSQTNVAPTSSHEMFRRALAEKLIVLSDAQPEIQQTNVSNVYPAETPADKSLVNASILDFHTQSSNDSLIDASFQDLDESMGLNATLDEDGMDLFKILQDLGGSADEAKETDGILSQVVRNEEDDGGGDDLDMSLPLDGGTPVKFQEKQYESDEDLFDDLLDTTLVPQLDGCCDNGSSSESDEPIARPSTQKKRKATKFPPLAVSVVNSSQSSNKKSDKEDTLGRVKRKLRFTRSSLSDETFVDEAVECRLTPKRNKKESGVNFETSPNKNEIIKDYFSVDFDEQPRKKFSCVEPLKHQPNLTCAQRYDIENNYRAKEGSSKKITQTSQSDFQSSSESLSHGAEEIGEPSPAKSTNSSSQSIKPYQLDQESLSQQTPSSNSSGFCLIQPKRKPPSPNSILKSMPRLNLPEIRFEPPFYSNCEDVTGSVEVGYEVLKIASKTTAHVDDFQCYFDAIKQYRKLYMPENAKLTHEAMKNVKLSYCSPEAVVVTPLKPAPTVCSVEKWLKEAKTVQVVEKTEHRITKMVIPLSPNADGDDSELELSLSLTPTPEEPVRNTRKVKKDNSAHISGISLNNTFGFKITPENYQDAKALNEFQHITMISLEVHVGTRGDFNPHPNYDQVSAIFYSIQRDAPNTRLETGLIAVNHVENVSVVKGTGIFCENRCVNTELELFDAFIELIHKHDPDIFLGYEIEMLSWGYLIERARKLGLDLMAQLSRIKEQKYRGLEEDQNMHITGRIVLDVWRLLKHEIALQSYTFESVMYHIVHRRVPKHSFKDLTLWWSSEQCFLRARTISYYLVRVESNLKMLEQLDVIGRTSELARLFGIQFFEVLSRGSQFRVESMMLRLAKPLNYIAVSPSVQQRAKMKAPEFLPLILEPQSKLYVDPVIVLDFQSLYPSIIIAYNYCFSTCLGKVKHLGKSGAFEFGATELKVSRKRLEKLLKRNCLNFSPCGVAFVKQSIRDGIMPRMLREILETRLMVKNSMKENRGNKVLEKVLHNRQLGLKLIANVTYGYTAANFSGRMPAVELGDSVVSKGRETLQRAIAMVESTPEWGAKVVYGDTDSLFVMTPGKSRVEAFEIGRKIADAVTGDNPNPVKLKLEKVYQPCILQTKKRYVGYMYESGEQKEPVYEAKGIETVRRDGCPAVSKMLEKCLRLLFETKDVSLVKSFVLRQFHKIISGRISIQDLTFAKEYRGAAGYKPGACVPALELARKWKAIDSRSEPRSGERVPYVICNGPPGLPLIRLVRSPHEFLAEPTLRPNVVYYITKVIIPPINRCFSLIGADLHLWYNQMPRKFHQTLPTSSTAKTKLTISQYFVSNSCAVCGDQTQDAICRGCKKDVQRTTVILCEKTRKWERANAEVSKICESCTGILDGRTACVSLDCPVLYKLNRTERDLQQAAYVRQILSSVDYGF